MSHSKDCHARELRDEDAQVRRAQEDPAAFGVLYERYVDQIFSYIYYRTADRQEAEDLTSRTFLRALRHLPRYELRGAPFSSWLYRIAHNLVVNWYHDRSRHRLIHLDELALPPELKTDDDPPNRDIEDEERRLLLDAIRRLPGDRQELIILKLSQGLSNTEIGQIMGRSEGAIKQLYYRTLRALRRELESLR